MPEWGGGRRRQAESSFGRVTARKHATEASDSESMPCHQTPVVRSSQQSIDHVPSVYSQPVSSLPQQPQQWPASSIPSPHPSQDPALTSVFDGHPDNQTVKFVVRCVQEVEKEEAVVERRLCMVPESK